MDRYVKLDDHGYLSMALEVPIIDDETAAPEGTILVTLPVDYDRDYMGCYKYTAGKLVLDKDKAAALKAHRLDIDARNKRAQRRQDALVRAVEIQAEAIAQSAATADDVIAIAPLLPPWVPKAYTVGDVITFEDAPYRCVQAHDAASNPGWTPRAAPSLWANYHATSAQYALPWAQPTGAHDMYKRGEWMIWTDGAKYECTQDTAYSPADQPQAWRRDSEDAGEPDDPDELPTTSTPLQWIQPTGEHDAYKMGDRVTHKGGVWISIADGNVWEPGVYGWTKV